MTITNKVPPFIAGFRTALTKEIRHDYFAIIRDFSVNRERIISKYRELLLSKINGFFALFDFTTGQYVYVSENIKDNLGYDVGNYTIDDFTNLSSIIYEKHAEFMANQFVPMLCKYLKENATEKTGTDYRYTCCCKLRNIYGVYEWYLLDTAVVQADSTGFPSMTLITCTNIRFFKKDDSLYYTIQKKNNDGMYRVMMEGVENDGLAEYNLTPREIQVVNLISQGFSNKKIADHLCISVYTVETHRKRIMKKVKCTGTAELTNFAFSKGLI
jgi:DNA-binding CsgD family transcriptional regulator